jgi:hypothetical protein
MWIDLHQGFPLRSNPWLSSQTPFGVSKSVSQIEQLQDLQVQDKIHRMNSKNPVNPVLKSNTPTYFYW